MKIIVAFLALALTLTACDPSATTPTDGSTDDGGSGFVLTPKGGIGIDMGGGLYIDPSTGGVGIGFPI